MKSGHSRFPIMNKESDESIGVLLAKDLLRHYMNEDNDALSLQNTFDRYQSFQNPRD